MAMACFNTSSLIILYLLLDKCKDDQLVITNYCRKIDYIDIDIDEIIFKNINFGDYKNINLSEHKQYFLGFPGQINFNRITRAPIEYGQFFIKPIIIIIVIVIYFLLTNNKFNVAMIIFIIASIYMFLIDKSCKL